MPESARRIAAATAAAFVTAAVVVGTAVLPAEFGLDPLGTGRWLGLLGLAEDDSRAIVQQEDRYATDEISFVLAPFESVEYKYVLGSGSSMLFSWEASAVVLYDFHAEPEGAEPGYAESFDRQRSERAHGSYTAPFAGIHGWFWENRGERDVTIRLETAGYYSGAIEFRDGMSYERSFAGASDAEDGTDGS